MGDGHLSSLPLAAFELVADVDVSIAVDAGPTSALKFEPISKRGVEGNHGHREFVAESTSTSHLIFPVFLAVGTNSIGSDRAREVMDVVHDRGVGIDISERDAKVSVRARRKKPCTFTSIVTTWGSTTAEIPRLREFFEQHHVNVVVMESTSEAGSNIGDERDINRSPDRSAHRCYAQPRTNTYAAHSPVLDRRVVPDYSTIPELRSRPWKDTTILDGRWRSELIGVQDFSGGRVLAGSRSTARVARMRFGCH